MNNFLKEPKKATRQAYGEALVVLGKKYQNLVVLDAGTRNSTYTELFKKAYPERFFEMFIAEQNMAGAGLGLSKSGYVVFMSTFAAFLTRAHDQLRMASYSNANIKICGSHAGVSIGEDGVSQMGLEDLAMFRSLFGSVVFYPSDMVSMAKLTELSYKTKGLVYLRSTRAPTPIIYSPDTVFEVGGLKVLRKSSQDQIAIIGAGITLFEALKAYGELEKIGVKARIIDLYCLKPLKKKKLIEAFGSLKKIMTVEDHYLEGGLGEAVNSVLVNNKVEVINLAVKKLPRSGSLAELLSYEEIDCASILRHVKKMI